MASAPGGKTTENKETAERPATAERLLVSERITVALIPRAAADLQHLQDKTGLSKTDLVNRATILYEFINERTGAGQEVLIRDPSTGETQTVVLL